MDWRRESRCLSGSEAQILETWMCVRSDLDWDGMHLDLGEMGLWLGWDAIIDIWMRWDVPWMEVIHDLDGGELRILGPWWNLGTWMEVRRYMAVGETRILGPGCRWERTWKHLASTFWDLGLRWRQSSPDEVFGTRMEWRDKSKSLAEGEMQILRLGWGWDGTWIELRQPSWDLNTL